MTTDCPLLAAADVPGDCMAAEHTVIGTACRESERERERERERESARVHARDKEAINKCDEEYKCITTDSLLTQDHFLLPL